MTAEQRQPKKPRNKPALPRGLVSIKPCWSQSRARALTLIVVVDFPVPAPSLSQGSILTERMTHEQHGPKKSKPPAESELFIFKSDRVVTQMMGFKPQREIGISDLSLSIT